MQDTKAFQKKVGAKVRKIRMAKRIRLVDLSYDLDITKQAVNNIEAGRKNITIGTVLKLSNALGVNPWELLDV